MVPAPKVRERGRCVRVWVWGRERKVVALTSQLAHWRRVLAIHSDSHSTQDGYHLQDGSRTWDRSQRWVRERRPMGALCGVACSLDGSSASGVGGDIFVKSLPINFERCTLASTTFFSGPIWRQNLHVYSSRQIPRQIPVYNLVRPQSHLPLPTVTRQYCTLIRASATRSTRSTQRRSVFSF